MRWFQRRSVYVVQRVSIREFCAWPNQLLTCCEDESSTVPSRAFVSKADADACCIALERQARATFPVLFGLGEILALRSDEIRAALRSIGLGPPSLKPISPEMYSSPQDASVPGSVVYTSKYFDAKEQQIQSFRRWWAEHAAEITPEQNAALWDALFPDWKFYTIQKVALKD